VSAPDGARADHAPAGLVGIRRGRQLDRVAIAVHLDDERRVVQVASLAVPAHSGDRLEQPAVEPDEVAARAERHPVEIHGRGG
jgi:hypothetical protein